MNVVVGQTVNCCDYIDTNYTMCNVIVSVLNNAAEGYYSKPLKCDDFRGLAISPILSKVFEYCFLDRFNHFLNTYDAQFGFKKA